MPTRLQVAGFVVDFAQEAIFDAAGRPVELRPQAFQVLRHLARSAGRLVTKDELMAAVWPEVVVTDDSLVQAIGDIRRALGDAGHRLVKTVPRRGYMLRAAAMADDTSSQNAGVTGTSSRPARRWLALGSVAILLLGVVVFWQERVRTDASGAVDDPGGPPSIAVLAFKGPPGDADGAVLARNVAADLVSELARSPNLRVVSSQSSFQFAEGKTPLAEIGRRLRSRHIVDGKVRREGEQLRMGVELLDSQDGRIVWSASDVVDRAELGAAQLALVGRIAGTLQAKVAATEQRRALAQPPKTLDAYVLVAHGRAMMVRYNADGIRASRRHFSDAIAIDPDYAAAWAFLGIANTVDIGLHLTGEWDGRRVDEVLGQIRRAIELQPGLPVAYVALSQAQSRAGDLDAALAAAQQACRLSPNDAECLYILGAAHLQLGQIEPALSNLEQAMNRNPLPPAYLPAFYATALWANRRFEEAIRAADDCLTRAPDFWRCRQDRIAALVELDRLPEARKEAALLQAKVPRIGSEWFGSTFGDRAASLRERRVTAARSAGIPDTPTVAQ
ncbi:winged helix-turn-helix domain-containing tetratricopeptide repeat protein [Variovorax ginsengisoli]|uniref:Winged helix-turn-helix domain-containing protein n=1 Tax=Variovorax ginsengisoli TaxID=363844 RepID=A0ABT8S576_9BURK|nr:winged helix-turn-helix domain-containing protein [Variovorax ginsengisoli]MDN8614903.1 winged helix-turn-helix domain-containing protein [Variovorax ginsengisoli]MDO1534073.1 winged helix-turn-helix domain-containing protein [Variovorax ginsengisoli]